jgi:hypothetical protein
MKERSTLAAVYTDKDIPTSRLEEMKAMIDDVAKRVYVETLLAKRALREKDAREMEAMVMCYSQMNSLAIQSMIDAKLPGTHLAAAKLALKRVKDEEKEVTAQALRVVNDVEKKVMAPDQEPSMDVEHSSQQESTTHEAAAVAAPVAIDHLAHLKSLKVDAQRRREEKTKRLEAVRQEIMYWDPDTIDEVMMDVADADERQMFASVLKIKRGGMMAACSVPPPPPYEHHHFPSPSYMNHY